MQTAPHDALRLGLPSLKEDVAPRHPVDEVQTTVGGGTERREGASARRPVFLFALTSLSLSTPQGAATAEATRLKMLADVYGGGLAARATIEKQILLR